MEQEVALLKDFFENENEDRNIRYQHFYNKGECIELEISNQRGDEYFFISAKNQINSVRGYYKLDNMDTEKSIVVDVFDVKDRSCSFKIRSMDNFEFSVTIDPE